MEQNTSFIPEIYIGENGNWFINGYDTGAKARGDDGITPHIGENGNWHIGEIDTGTPARGPEGDKGDKGDTGAMGAQGPQGIQGVKGDKGDTGPAGPVNIVNNLETTEEGYALDARQGKILRDTLSNNLGKLVAISTFGNYVKKGEVITLTEDYTNFKMLYAKTGWDSTTGISGIQIVPFMPQQCNVALIPVFVRGTLLGCESLTFNSANHRQIIISESNITGGNTGIRQILGLR